MAPTHGPTQLKDFIDPSDLAKTEHLELLAKQIVDGFLAGRHRSKLKGGSAEFVEHRAYSPGDEIRLLDWRALGKSERYYIKQFVDETSVQVMLAVDASGSMGFGLSTMSKFEYARAAALCLARLVLRQGGDAAGLSVLGGGIQAFVPPRTQPRHLEVLIKNLRHVSPAGPGSLAEDLGELARRMKRRGLIALFSDCFEDVDRLAQSLRFLRSRRHEVLLFHVLAPEELSFSFRQWSRFVSLEVDGQSIDLDPVSVRGEYLARLKAFLGKVRQACGEASCDYIPLSTDKPLGQTLAEYLRRRAATIG